MIVSKRVKFIQNASGNLMHRKQRIGTARILTYFFEYIGDLLYYLGLTIEREYKNTLRSIRRGIKRSSLSVLRFLVFIFRTLGRFLLTVILDFLNPFIKIGRSIRSLGIVLRAERKKGIRGCFSRFGSFIKYGWIWNKHLLVRFFNQLIPVVSLAVLIVSVIYITKLNFALAVVYKGDNIGYIASEQILDSATVIIRERMVESDDMSWTSSIKLGISIVAPDEVLSNRVVADNMLTASGIGIMQATGLYIDNVFYGATTQGEDLIRSLDSLLEKKRHSISGEELKAEFINRVELRDGVYPEQSIFPFEELDGFVNSNRNKAIYYTVKEEETIDDILENSGIDLAVLQRLNRNYDFAYLEAGQKLLIEEAIPMLPVRVTRIEMELEEIPIELEEYLDPNRSTSFIHEYIAGEAGIREVYYEIHYDNGVETGRTVVDVNVLREMTKRVVVKGTKVNVGFGGRPPVTGGRLGWPTGVYQKLSRGSSENHIALDIACETGTNVFAVESGTVVSVIWSNVSYGNHIIIDHGIIDGVNVRTLYAHNSELLVTEGQHVAKGELIAYSGSTGNSTGPHLHFEVRVDGNKVPPEPWVGMG